MIASLSESFGEWKKSRGLLSPGSYESMHKEARNVTLSNLLFEGGKADLAKGLSPNFQVAHSFSIGTGMFPSLYHFGAVYLNGKHLLHGMIDSQGSFQGKYVYSFIKDIFQCKFQSHIVPSQQQFMLQSEIEYLGPDYSLNAKAINPNAADGTGIYTLSYLQSLTSKLALGAEVIVQKMGREPFDTGLNLVAKLNGSDWIATATLQQFVALQLSYWQRVSEKVELGSELQILNAGPTRNESVTSVSAKFDYKQCTVRTQIDSQMKVALLMEEKIFPGFSLLISGELDHLKGTNRFGVGVNLEN